MQSTGNMVKRRLSRSFGLSFLYAPYLICGGISDEAQSRKGDSRSTSDLVESRMGAVAWAYGQRPVSHSLPTVHSNADENRIAACSFVIRWSEFPLEVSKLHTLQSGHRPKPNEAT